MCVALARSPVSSGETSAPAECCADLGCSIPTLSLSVSPQLGGRVAYVRKPALCLMRTVRIPAPRSSRAGRLTNSPVS